MKTILILSSDQEVVEVLKAKLTYFDFNVINIKSNDSVFDSVSIFKPDLVLIDFFLKEGNGGSICHQLKCDSKSHQVPVILLTEHKELIPVMKKFGCDDSVVKPLNFPDLLYKIVQIMGNKMNLMEKPEMQYLKNDSNSAVTT